MKPILTICIPTYNRLIYIKELLDKLLPQLNEKVEVLVSDNCSNDGTWEYLISIANIKKHRHTENIGADRNVVSVVQIATTKYIWLLCDDDLPSNNLVNNILEVIENYDNPPLIYLKAYGMARNGEGYNPSIQVDTWRVCSFDEFLQEVGIWFTFGSSIIARKDCIDFDFVKKWIDKSLTPAAMALISAYYEQKIVISHESVLAARGGNSGGYDAITVFTKNVNLLLNEFPEAISQKTIEKIRKDSLLIIAYILSEKSYTLSFSSFINLVKFGWRYKGFYTVIVATFLFKKIPIFTILKKIKTSVTIPFKQCFKNFVKQALISIKEDECQVIKDSLGYCGNNIRFGNDIEVINPKYISIEDNFRCASGIRLHCWYDSSRKEPSLKIGKDVFLNNMSYISCSSSIEIEDNVLIGSNVFITDNYHGDTSKVISNRLQAPLFIKGSVKICSGVWLGNNVCIMPKVVIGSNSIIGANSVVNSDIPANVIAAGSPARIVKELESQ